VFKSRRCPRNSFLLYPQKRQTNDLACRFCLVYPKGLGYNGYMSNEQIIKTLEAQIKILERETQDEYVAGALAAKREVLAMLVRK